MTRHFFVKSGRDSIYVEIGYPKRNPAPAVLVMHGLRSYYPGFLDMFAKRLRKEGYISVKFHFVGTGKSSGKFEDKTTTAMLKNYEDVVAFLKTRPEISSLGLVARSNAGSLALLHGPDQAIKALVLLASPIYYSRALSNLTTTAKLKNGFFYHPSFKRLHTKGPGRLPSSYMDDLKKYDLPLLKAVKKMQRVLYIQSVKDEVVLLKDGHFEYCTKNLPEPKKTLLMPDGNHSYKGHKKEVITEAVHWLKRFLPR